MPHVPRWVREWTNNFFGVSQPVFDPAATYEAQLAEQAAAARQEKIAYARRLSPFAGRLLLVTDFGPDEAPDYQAAHATRLATVIRSEVFSPHTPLGLSAHLTSGRKGEGKQGQRTAAKLLASSLGKSGFENVLPTQTYEDDQDYWLRTVTLAAEETARVYKTAPSQVGHIAIVFAMDVHHADIFSQPIDGEAFLLAEAHDTPKFTWRTLQY